MWCCFTFCSCFDLCVWGGWLPCKRCCDQNSCGKVITTRLDLKQLSTFACKKGHYMNHIMRKKGLRTYADSVAPHQLAHLRILTWELHCLLVSKYIHFFYRNVNTQWSSQDQTVWMRRLILTIVIFCASRVNTCTYISMVALRLCYWTILNM